MNNDITIHRDSIKLNQNPTNKNEYFLTFTFDSLVEVIVSVFFNCIDKLDFTSDLTAE